MSRYFRLPVISLVFAALAFGGFGVALLIWPELLEAVGVEIVRPAGAVEIRGFYGGLEVGLACFFAMAILRREWHRSALVVQVVTLGGVVLGRVIGNLAGGGGEPLIVALGIAESAGAALGLAALRVLRRQRVTARTLAPSDLWLFDE